MTNEIRLFSHQQVQKHAFIEVVLGTSDWCALMVVVAVGKMYSLRDAICVKRLTQPLAWNQPASQP
jgi:hypothetical protein